MGLRQRIEIDGFAGEKHRTVDPLLDDRFRTELASERGCRLISRIAPLCKGDGPCGDREREEPSDAGQEEPEAPVPAPLRPQVALALVTARVEEVPFEVVEVARVLHDPVEPLANRAPR